MNQDNETMNESCIESLWAIIASADFRRIVAYLSLIELPFANGFESIFVDRNGKAILKSSNYNEIKGHFIRSDLELLKAR